MVENALKRLFLFIVLFSFESISGCFKVTSNFVSHIQTRHSIEFNLTDIIKKRRKFHTCLKSTAKDKYRRNQLRNYKNTTSTFKVVSNGLTLYLVEKRDL